MKKFPLTDGKPWFFTVYAQILGAFFALTVIILALVHLATIVGIPYTPFKGSYFHQKQQALRRLKLIADLKKEQLVSLVNERKGDTQVLAQNRAVSSAVEVLTQSIRSFSSRGGSSGALGVQLQGVKEYTSVARELMLLKNVYNIYKKINIIDTTSGIIVVSTDSEATGQKTALVSPEILRGVTALTVRSVSEQGWNYLVIMNPIVVDASIPAPAVIAAYVDLEKVIASTLYKGEWLGPRGEALLVDEQSYIVASRPARKADADGDPKMSKTAALARQSGEEFVESTDYRGERTLATYRPIDFGSRVSWGLVVKTDESDVFGPMRRQTMYSVVVGLLGLLIAAVLMSLLARRISTPIGQLAHAAASFREGDLSARAPAPRDDEVGRLAAVFNSMLDKVRYWHRDLNEQVSLKTQELEQLNADLRHEVVRRSQAQDKLTSTNNTLATLNACNDALLHATDQRALYKDVCRIIVENSGYRLAWIGLFQGRDKAALQPAAKWGEDNGDSRAMSGAADARQSILDAMAMKTPIVFDDNADHPPVPFDRFDMAADGLFTGAALPLVSDHDTFGVLTINTDTPNSFTPDELTMLMRLAENVSYGVTFLRSRQDLMESEEKYRYFVEHANSIIMRWDTKGRITYLNEFGQEYFGYEEAELLGKSTIGAIIPQVQSDGRDLASMVADVLAHPDHYAKNEHENITRDGSRVWVSWTNKPILDAKGNVVEILSVGNDISERKLFEEEREHLITELESKNAELERFTYTVSHDLKSPLITIKSFLGFVEQDALQGKMDRLRGDLKRIGAAADKMADLLDELLELSRIGRLNNPPTTVDFNKLTADTLELLSGGILAKGTEIHVQPDMPPVYADKARLLQVVQNLIENALKFMGDQPNPTITVGAVEQARETRFFVKDNGVGIDPAYHEKIFGLFDKLDQSTPGYGTGLALVRRIIAVHGGHIWVESQGAGKGSTFFFTLPEQMPTLKENNHSPYAEPSQLHEQ